MVTYLSGFSQVGLLWEAIATDLISSKPSWDFEGRGAPDGPYAKIVNIEIGALFVTVARRALSNDRVFERSSITRPYLDAMLRPHRKGFDDLVGAITRKNAINRTNKSISDDMAHLVFFDLFDVIEEKKIWRLTDKGVSFYERFNQEIEGGTEGARSSRRDIPAVGYASFGYSVSGRLGGELIVHYRW